MLFIPVLSATKLFSCASSHDCVTPRKIDQQENKCTFMNDRQITDAIISSSCKDPVARQTTVVASELASSSMLAGARHRISASISVFSLMFKVIKEWRGVMRTDASAPISKYWKCDVFPVVRMRLDAHPPVRTPGCDGSWGHLCSVRPLIGSGPSPSLRSSHMILITDDSPCMHRGSDCDSVWTVCLLKAPAGTCLYSCFC